MELLDYARLRWKVLAGAFVVGVVAIVALAAGSPRGGGHYTAQVRLLIRPPAAQLSVFGFNLDRYIGTEIATLYSDSSLDSEADGTPFTPSELDAALTTSHTAGTDLVTLTIRADGSEDAIATANHVAEVYLSDAQERTTESNQRSVDYLQRQLADEQGTVKQANAALAEAFRAARAARPRIASVDPSLLDPDAYSQQQIAIASVQQLQQQLLELQLSSRATGLSRVLNAADAASPSAEPWRPTTVAAALVGLLLALVAAAAIALSLSRRVVSADRWSRLTEGSGLRPAVRTHGRQQRAGDLRRIVAAVATADATGPVSVSTYPTSTKRSTRASAELVDDLNRVEVSAHLATETTDALHLADLIHGSDDDSSVVVMVVDLAACRVEDATVLSDARREALHRVVPVLI